MSSVLIELSLHAVCIDRRSDAHERDKGTIDSVQVSHISLREETTLNADTVDNCDLSCDLSLCIWLCYLLSIGRYILNLQLIIRHLVSGLVSLRLTHGGF